MKQELWCLPVTLVNAKTGSIAEITYPDVYKRQVHGSAPAGGKRVQHHSGPAQGRVSLQMRQRAVLSLIHI